MISLPVLSMKSPGALQIKLVVSTEIAPKAKPHRVMTSSTSLKSWGLVMLHKVRHLNPIGAHGFL